MELKLLIWFLGCCLLLLGYFTDNITATIVIYSAGFLWSWLRSTKEKKENE